MTTRRVLLGLFILWQLVFIIGTNLNDFFQYGPRHVLKDDGKKVAQTALPGWPKNQGGVSDLSNTARDISFRYTHLTGQEQIWSLFAPGAWRSSSFVAVELRWDPDKPGELLLSPNEPESLDNYFRLGLFRWRRAESQITLTLLPDPCEPPEITKTRWAGDIVEHVRAYHDLIHAFLDWRWRQYLAEHPGTATPQEIRLVGRSYHIPEYDEAPPYCVGPRQTTIARWRPGVDLGAGYLRLEAYDPQTDSFLPLRK